MQLSAGHGAGCMGMTLWAKRCLTLALALLQVLSLSACTGRPDTHHSSLRQSVKEKAVHRRQSAPFDDCLLDCRAA